MKGDDAFFDTNILLYLLSVDTAKADRAEEVIAAGGIVSVRVLNEFVAVATRKLGMPWHEIEEVLAQLRAVLQIEALTIETHERGLAIAKRYGFSIYDCLIAASALNAECTVLYSEDFQHGQVVDERLTVCNPFIASRETE